MIFPQYSNPRISIVMILFNKAEYTYECLQSIQQFADVPYELILIDNGSSDDTPRLLQRLENVVSCRNESNIGFVKACNKGVLLSQGEWILFLNNDTQITRGLLSKMLQTAEQTPACGAVGAKIVLFDGKLQEAGSILWNDGSCMGYGRGDHPNKPEYSYVREVHYCSGACLLVNKTAFVKAGMFDERYSPAYYEETDLCMQLREMGYKVIYQPEAVVYHHEFGSSDATAAFRQQSENQVKFKQKWHHRLSEYDAPAVGHAFAASDVRKRSFRILVVDDRIPDPELGSGFPRIYAILNLLAEMDARVTFFPMTDPRPIAPINRQFQQKGIEVVYSTWLGRPEFASFYSQRKQAYDVVWVSRPHNMKAVVDAINTMKPDQRIVYDAEALFSIREIRKLELHGQLLPANVKNEMTRKEIRLMDNADTVITVSENERRMIGGYTNRRVEVLGHRLEVRATPKPFGERRDLLFVGGFLESPSPNEDAMMYFVRQVMPRVSMQLDARLYIVGTNKLESIRRLAADNIVVTGRVNDLWEYYNNCRLFVAPTRYAAGIPYKVDECLSHGLPAVVTPLIAEQLGIGESVVSIGYDADDMAKKIVMGYTNERLWGFFRSNGLDYIRRECDLEAYKRKLRSVLFPISN